MFGNDPAQITANLKRQLKKLDNAQLAIMLHIIATEMVERHDPRRGQ